MIFISSGTLFAQITDDFESGNINAWTESASATWGASTDNPINGTYSLQHISDGGAGEDQISRPFSGIGVNSGTTSWQFQIKHGYNPSAYNNWAFFLFSNAAASEMYAGGNASGYAIGVNFTGSDDTLCLWKISDGTLSEVIRTDINWENDIGTGAAGIQVTRSAAGDWSVELDNNGGFDNLVNVGTGNDASHTEALFLGVFYEFSSAHVTDFWFDDLAVTGPPDTQAPIIENIRVKSNNSLQLTFSEDLEEITAETTSNYFVDGNIGNPSSAALNTLNHREVELSFSQTFSENTNYQLTVNNVEDLSGNAVNNESVNFSYILFAPVSVSVINQNVLDILFNKSLDITTAQTSTNYLINKGIEHPLTASLDAQNDKLVHLDLASPLMPAEDYILSVENIESADGEVINAADLPFSYYETQAFDIVINEIMCDVNPEPEALPVHEYIEIYNTSDYAVNLKDWTLKIGTNAAKTFPAKTIPAGGYAIICEDDAEAEFAAYGMTIGILRPSELTTTGKQILIKNSSELIIEAITYSKDWYHDDEKNKGGWSMERIDPTNFCGEETNWTATTDYSGGTPGRENSVFASNQDNTVPELLSIDIISANYIVLKFNEKISAASCQDNANFTINKGIGNALSAVPDSETGMKVHLIFSNMFQDKENYRLLVKNVSDNCGNAIEETSYDFSYQRIHATAIEVKEKNQLKLYFSETPDSASATKLLNYSCDSGLGNPEFALRDLTDSTIVHLTFADDFPDGKELHLTVSGIQDINGNSMKDTVLTFAYYLPKPGDIAINEVLFKPFPNGDDFVELYNKTDFPLDLNHLQLAKRDSKNPDSLIQLSPLAVDDKIFLPRTYLAFTKDKQNVLNFYMSQDEENLLEIAKFPSFPDKAGTVVLLYKDTLIIDEFAYDESMHFPLLDDDEGVSLERVNYNKPTQDASNWHSASELVGFATPAYQNSQFNDDMQNENEAITIKPHVFSPDNDGYNDYANIHFSFGTPDNIADIIVFNSKGQIIKKLAEHLLLPSEGTLVWNGITENARIASAGTYVLYFKVFDMNGNVKIYKKTLVLAKKI